jgi:hypothetical protein
MSKVAIPMNRSLVRLLGVIGRWRRSNPVLRK